MSNPFLGEIRMFGGNFNPRGWAFCNGTLLPIDQNEALFALIGTTYGGDGTVNFALPNLQSRVPIHQGSGRIPGQIGGAEEVTLTTQQIPGHSHAFNASKDQGATTNPPSNVLGQIPLGNVYIQDQASVALSNQSVALTGGNQPHENMQPFLVITFIIALVGVFPQRN